MGVLTALDESLPAIEWGDPESRIQELFPGGRSGPGQAYAVLHPLIGYPYPIALFFGFGPGLRSIQVEYPRTLDLVTGDMEFPGRMVAESIYRHLSALLIIAYGGARDPYADPLPPERGETVLADHTWSTADTSARLEFRLQSGLGRVRVELRSLGA